MKFCGSTNDFKFNISSVVVVVVDCTAATAAVAEIVHLSIFVIINTNH
jgi:hypothetical protein